MKGEVDVFVNRVRRESLGSQVDVHSVRQWFGDVKGSPRIDHLVNVQARGVPVNVQPGDNVVNAINYGNHSGVDEHEDCTYDQLRLDVTNGRALVFDLRRNFDIRFLRVSLFRVVVHPKFRIIQDTFTYSPRRTPHTSDHAGIDFLEAPQCAIGVAPRKVLMRILFLRQKAPQHALW